MQGLSRSPNGESQCAVCAAHSGLAGKLAEQSDKLQFAELAQRFTKPHFIEHIQCRRYRMAKNIPAIRVTPEKPSRIHVSEP